MISTKACRKVSQAAALALGSPASRVSMLEFEMRGLNSAGDNTSMGCRHRLRHRSARW